MTTTENYSDEVLTNGNEFCYHCFFVALAKNCITLEQIIALMCRNADDERRTQIISELVNAYEAIRAINDAEESPTIY